MVTLTNYDRLHGWLASPAPSNGVTPLFLDVIVQGQHRAGSPHWFTETLHTEIRLLGAEVARIESATEPPWGWLDVRRKRGMYFTPAQGPQVLGLLWARDLAP